ncbi:ubiquitin-conjugating enzyme E2 [Aspergillus saccharolyticus JOP 1030-1]|uniref:SUMO-conjugating enzyme UBC9 n=1 Tax=Aspergillus saccharolyticus JOP 1030-1 TaxID=1450539 RepID=A0A318YZH3_9EURO|nr:putative SUMO conjugating enzyme [Aspergillus saccharolyticus JOP 1030-1]PYH40411.1 putative SUMO conjugating enzyme [Aspergillus saccharolyticus JOP 1030-1]
MSLRQDRLVKELRKWRKKPLFGFYARPSRTRQGVRDIKIWECGIPGKVGTMWEGGLFKMKMFFPEEYPNKPPKCQFDPPLFHPNVYPNGVICLSILNPQESWSAVFSIKEILLGVQELLDNPNLMSPAQTPSYQLCKKDPDGYRRKIQQVVQENLLHQV